MKKAITLLVLILCFTATRLMATVLYVDSTATGTNTGASWANAYTTLSMALSQAAANTSIDSILVAKGTYYPTGIQSGSNRDSAFTILRGGLKVYGGYPSGGGARNNAANPTILSGNIGNAATNGDNSYHVMVIANPNQATADSVVIDGFTIRNGSATGMNSYTYGSVIIGRSNGGGIWLQLNANNLKAVLRELTITGNDALFSGSGMYMSSTSATITNCIFSGNTLPSGNHGSGMYIFLASPRITRCVFTGNTCPNGDGGGICNQNSSPSIINCTFSGNSAREGAGIINLGSTPVITNCSFSGNTATANGGAMYNGGSSPVITNSIIYGNTAPAGAGIYNIGTPTSAPIISYSLVQGYTYAVGAVGNLPNTTNPLFVSTTDLHLQSTSPCINTGSNAAVPPAITTDLDGNARIQGGTVDRGAYEYAMPPLPFVSLGNDTSICSGNTITLNAQNPGCTYLWNTGATTQTITANTTGTYYVTVTNASGPASDTIQITANPLPVVNLGNDTAFCAGDTLLLDAQNAGATYLWSNAATPQTMQVNSSGTYSVAVTDANQCKAIDTIEVTVNPLPMVNLGSDTSFCAGNTLLLDAQHAGAVYLWSTTAVTQTIQANSSGAYSVTVTDANQCIGTDTIQVTVNPLPVVDMGSDITLAAGDSATLDAGNSGATYEWSTGEDTRTITVNTAGTYSVQVTNADGCSAGDTILVSIHTVGIDPLASDKEEITISPNPAKDMLTISIGSDKLLHTKTILTDVYGRAVKTVTMESRMQTLSLNDLAEGVYLIHMQNGATFKVVKK